MVSVAYAVEYQNLKNPHESAAEVLWSATRFPQECR